MRRWQAPYYGKRYLLNTNTNELHDLDAETPECRISEIKLDHIVMFDSLQEGLTYQVQHAGKSNGCYWCLRAYHTG